MVTGNLITAHPPIMNKTITVAQIRQAAQEAFDESRNLKGGANADYIPYLANIDSNLFGLSITLLDGQVINIGDTDLQVWHRINIKGSYSHTRHAAARHGNCT